MAPRLKRGAGAFRITTLIISHNFFDKFYPFWPSCLNPCAVLSQLRVLNFKAFLCTMTASCGARDGVATSCPSLVGAQGAHYIWSFGNSFNVVLGPVEIAAFDDANSCFHDFVSDSCLFEIWVAPHQSTRRSSVSCCCPARFKFQIPRIPSYSTERNLQHTWVREVYSKQSV